MNKESNRDTERRAGADAITAKAIAIGKEHQVMISEWVWDMGEDLEHEHAHRLDLITATKVVRLYFSDLELTTSNSPSRAKRTEDRLRRAIAQLLPRPPLPTYAFQ